MALPLKVAMAVPGKRRLAKAIAIAGFGICLLPVMLIAIIVPVEKTQQAQCSDLQGVGGDPVGASVGALGGISGTGITRTDLRTVRAGRTPHVSPGSYVATSYGPPWGGIQGPGIATSAGLRINGGAPKKYWIAVDPALITYGSWVYLWPNPFQWKGPFLAADTGGAIKSRRIDFYDWRGRAEQNGWGRREVRVSAKPILESGLTDAPSVLAGSDDPPAGTGPVLLLGDSLGVGAGLAGLSDKLGGRSLTLNAKSGRSSGQGLQTLRGLSTKAKTWVIVLGTNDTSVSQFRKNVRSIKALARSRAASIHWVTVARKSLGGTTDSQLNAVLRDELSSSQLVDWNARVRAGRATLEPDRVHPTSAGYRSLVQLIVTAVGSPDAAAAATGGDPSCADNGMEIGGSGAGREAVKIAVRFLGRNARATPFRGFEPPSVQYAWCAWFVTNAWRQAGVKIPMSAFSGYPYQWATASHPDLVIKRVGQRAKTLKLPVGTALMFGSGPATAGTSSHINMVRSVNPDGTVMIIGGNQDGSRVTSYGPCRLANGPSVRLTGPGCDSRPVYGIVAPSLDSSSDEPPKET